NTKNFVICGQDCNKNMPKIIACFDSKEDCLVFLNRKGQSINKHFNINDYISDEEYIEMCGADVIFENLSLFRLLFVDGFMITGRCLHRGEIIIYCIDKNDGLADVYEMLKEMYA